MEKLQKAAKDVVASVSTEDKRDSLSRAFEIFSYETVRLEKAYDSLNEQFQTLNLELQEANHKLHSKVAELDIMTDYLRSILDNIAQGILVVDLNGLVTTYNRAAEAILGVPAKQAIFHSFWNNFADGVFGFSMQEVLQKRITAANYAVSYTTPDNIHCELEVVTAFALKGAMKDRRKKDPEPPPHARDDRHDPRCHRNAPPANSSRQGRQDEAARRDGGPSGP